MELFQRPDRDQVMEDWKKELKKTMRNVIEGKDTRKMSLGDRYTARPPGMNPKHYITN